MISLDHAKDHLIRASRNFPRLSSTWHPYGFVVVKIGNLGERQTARLHIWPRHHEFLQYPVWPIHNHPWRLTSLVIAGKLCHRVYTTIKSSRGEYQLYRVEYDGSNSILHRTKTTVKCHLESTTTIQRGCVYDLKPTAYHEIEVARNELTSTFVVTESVDNRAPHVLGNRDGEQRYEFERVVVDAESLRRLMNELMNEFDRP